MYEIEEIAAIHTSNIAKIAREIPEYGVYREFCETVEAICRLKRLWYATYDKRWMISMEDLIEPLNTDDSDTSLPHPVMRDIINRYYPFRLGGLRHTSDSLIADKIYVYLNQGFVKELIAEKIKEQERSN